MPLCTDDPPMTNLTHTHTPSFAEPYVSHQGEARWYGNSLWEFLVPNEVTGGKLSVFQATMPEASARPGTSTRARTRCSS